MRHWHLCVFWMLVAAGCAMQQQVSIARFEGNQICVVENGDVEPVFLHTYVRALEEKGYAVRILPVSAATTDCSVTSTYRGKWAKDVGRYLVYAEIKVYEKGVVVGRAGYDTSRRNLSLNKFNDAQTVTELVTQLFPAKGVR